MGRSKKDTHLSVEGDSLIQSWHKRSEIRQLELLETINWFASCPSLKQTTAGSVFLMLHYSITITKPTLTYFYLFVCFWKLYLHRKGKRSFISWFTSPIVALARIELIQSQELEVSSWSLMCIQGPKDLSWPPPLS